MSEELTEKQLGDAAAWFKGTPDSGAAVAVAFLALLTGRGAVSEDTAVSDKEADLFVKYVSDAVSDIRMLGLLVSGMVEMKYDTKAKDWSYSLTEKGRQRASKTSV